MIPNLVKKKNKRTIITMKSEKCGNRFARSIGNGNENSTSVGRNG